MYGFSWSFTLYSSGKIVIVAGFPLDHYTSDWPSTWSFVLLNYNNQVYNSTPGEGGRNDVPYVGH